MRRGPCCPHRQLADAPGRGNTLARCGGSPGRVAVGEQGARQRAFGQRASRSPMSRERFRPLDRFGAARDGDGRVEVGTAAELLEPQPQQLGETSQMHGPVGRAGGEAVGELPLQPQGLGQTPPVPGELMVQAQRGDDCPQHGGAGCVPGRHGVQCLAGGVHRLADVGRLLPPDDALDERADQSAQGQGALSVGRVQGRPPAVNDGLVEVLFIAGQLVPHAQQVAEVGGPAHSSGIVGARLSCDAQAGRVDGPGQVPEIAGALEVVVGHAGDRGVYLRHVLVPRRQHLGCGLQVSRGGVEIVEVAGPLVTGGQHHPEIQPGGRAHGVLSAPVGPRQGPGRQRDGLRLQRSVPLGAVPIPQLECLDHQLLRRLPAFVRHVPPSPGTGAFARRRSS